MSEDQNFGFGKFVPGFDFLQNLAKGASQTLPLMPNLSNWVAPTLSVEELDKRIGDLKAVHFWLDQNSKALSATIQALEVQKMTLATLKRMNLGMGELANAMQLNVADAMGAAAGKAKAPRTATSGNAAKPAAGVVDPLQWWSALTQQFQEIAASAMKEAAAPSPAPGGQRGAGSAAKTPAKRGGKRPAKKAAR